MTSVWQFLYRERFVVALSARTAGGGFGGGGDPRDHLLLLVDRSEVPAQDFPAWAVTLF